MALSIHKRQCKPTFGLILLLLATTWTNAQVPAPPRPLRYRAYLRYKIGVPRPEAFKRFEAALKAQGFDRDKRSPDDPDEADAEKKDKTFVSMTGELNSSNVDKVMDVPGVQGLLLYPKDYVLPKDPKEPVKVSISISEYWSLPLRKRLADQLRPLLEREGFREAIGYDTRAQNRLVGTLPAGRLETILQDLRAEEPELPGTGSIKGSWPVRRVEVLPEPPGVEPIKPYVPLPPSPQGWAAISPELSRLLPLPGMKTNPQRIEVVLFARPEDGVFDFDFQEVLLRAVPNSVIEDRMGPVVSLKTGLENVVNLAKLREVSTIRLPRNAAPSVLHAPAEADTNAMAFRTWSVTRLHEKGRRGRGIRVAVISDDFRSYPRFIGIKLPSNTKLIDFTAERAITLLPEPTPGNPLEIGVGTYQALAVALAAPEAEMTLVRISRSAPYQLHTIARYLAGETPLSYLLTRRADDLSLEVDSIRREQQALLEERREVFERVRDDAGWRRRRDDYLKKQAELDAKERAEFQRLQRYRKLLDDLRSLAKVTIVSSTLSWPEGYPVDGGSFLSRRLDDHVEFSRKPKHRLWLQAAGDAQGAMLVGIVPG